MNFKRQQRQSLLTGGSRAALLIVTLLTVGVVMLATQVNAINLGPDEADQTGAKPAPTFVVIENPDNAAQVLESLLRNIVYSPNTIEIETFRNAGQKRGLDLGISRGFSGSQAGKHLMGLSAARFANGPGK